MFDAILRIAEHEPVYLVKPRDQSEYAGRCGDDGLEHFRDRERSWKWCVRKFGAD